MKVMVMLVIRDKVIARQGGNQETVTEQEKPIRGYFQ